MTKNEIPPLSIPVIIKQVNGQPGIELRRLTLDKELIKGIISAAYRNQPILILPTFTDPIKSISSILEKGIAYRDPETQQLFYNI